MQKNTLQLETQTLRNVDNVLMDIQEEFCLSKEDCFRKLNSENILVEVIGRIILIPFKKVIVGDIVNEEFLEENPLLDPIYEKLEIESLTKEEIKQIILDKFIYELNTING